VTAPDPRHPALGWRTIAAAVVSPGRTAADYVALRLTHGVPDGSRDRNIEKDFWLETDAERLNGVSFTKGCFIGQELTARMKHRTTLKKRLVPVCVDGGAPEAGTPVETDGGKTAGEIRSSAGDLALAYLRLEHLDSPLTTDSKPLRPVLDG
jgi:folate-binding protein YgfZ